MRSLAPHSPIQSRSLVFVLFARWLASLLVPVGRISQRLRRRVMFPQVTMLPAPRRAAGLELRTILPKNNFIVVVDKFGADDVTLNNVKSFWFKRDCTVVEHDVMIRAQDDNIGCSVAHRGVVQVA